MTGPRIDDICPGAFAEPPMIIVQMAVGQERFDWLALERAVLAGFGWPHMGPVVGLRDVYAGDQRMQANSIVQTFVEPDPEAYPMSIGEPTLDNCPACKGTGEINEFPADDDERLVACPTCGGTGEVYQ